MNISHLRVEEMFGSRTYPVEYTYDLRVAQHTMKTFGKILPAILDGGDHLELCDHIVGVGHKRYADATGPMYTYTAGGHPETSTTDGSRRSYTIILRLDVGVGSDHGQRAGGGSPAV